MKAILLAGGMGTRLRPLTAHTPKPIVPIFNRPFLYYQLDLLRQIPEIDEVILSLNYQPRRIEEIFGDGSDLGLRIRYVVEPQPLGTAGAVKYAEEFLTDSVVVFNGDVLTQIDLASVIRLHRERKARATIVLTPVENLGRAEYEVGLHYFRVKWYPGAMDRFAALLKRDPEFSYRDGPYFYMGESICIAGRPAEALPYYDKVIKEFEKSEFLKRATEKVAAINRDASAACPAPKPK